MRAKNVRSKRFLAAKHFAAQGAAYVPSLAARAGQRTDHIVGQCTGLLVPARASVIRIFNQLRKAGLSYKPLVIKQRFNPFIMQFTHTVKQFPSLIIRGAYALCYIDLSSSRNFLVVRKLIMRTLVLLNWSISAISA